MRFISGEQPFLAFCQRALFANDFQKYGDARLFRGLSPDGEKVLAAMLRRRAVQYLTAKEKQTTPPIAARPRGRAPSPLLTGTPRLEFSGHLFKLLRFLYLGVNKFPVNPRFTAGDQVILLTLGEYLQTTLHLKDFRQALFLRIAQGGLLPNLLFFPELLGLAPERVGDLDEVRREDFDIDVARVLFRLRFHVRNRFINFLRGFPFEASFEQLLAAGSFLKSRVEKLFVLFLQLGHIDLFEPFCQGAALGFLEGSCLDALKMRISEVLPPSHTRRQEMETRKKLIILFSWLEKLRKINDQALRVCPWDEDFDHMQAFKFFYASIPAAARENIQKTTDFLENTVF